MSSGGNIQQTYQLLQQIYALMQQIDTKTDKTQRDLEKTTLAAIQLQQILNRSLLLFRRMGLPENVDSAIYKLQRLIMIINQVRLAALALYSSHPALAVIGLTMVALDVGDLMMNS